MILNNSYQIQGLKATFSIKGAVTTFFFNPYSFVHQVIKPGTTDTEWMFYLDDNNGTTDTEWMFYLDDNYADWEELLL